MKRSVMMQVEKVFFFFVSRNNSVYQDLSLKWHIEPKQAVQGMCK